MNLKLRPFDPSRIADDKICVFVGKRGFGKSWLMRDIMWHKRHIQSGVLMSATEDNTGFWRKHIPDIFIHNGGYNPELVSKIMEKQKSRARRHGKESVDPVFVIAEDCMYDKTINKDRTAAELFMNGRHLKVFFMLTMQYVMSIPPNLRSNVDYLFILKENNYMNREKLYKQYFGFIPNVHVFGEILNQTTTDYSALVLDNTTTSNRIEDMVFWYKAKDHGSFRVGGDRFWRFHDCFYRRTDPDDEDAEGRRGARGGKGNTQIVLAGRDGPAAKRARRR